MALPDLQRGKSPPGHFKDRHTTIPSGPAVAFTVSILLIFASLATAVRALPQEPLVPAVVTLSFALAGLAALIGWCTRQNSKAEHLTYWDVAGALAFIGIGLSVLVEPEQIVRLVNGAHGE